MHQIILKYKISLLVFSGLIVLQSCNTPKTASRESLKKPEKFVADSVIYDKASPFYTGFAKVVKDSSSFYIDKKGRYAFDKTMDTFFPLDSVTPDGYGRVSLHKNKDKLMRIIKTKDGKFGMVNKQGQWIFKPEYDTIQFQFKRYIKLKKDGKMTYADSQGKLLVPLKFQDVGIMNGDYYDVKKDGKWGVYQASTEKIIIPFDYEKFDYCGGCGSTPNYFYAQKNRKWGVIDLNNKILVPFKYEHQHYNMRSDNWVTAFHKNKKPVVIDISSNKEYSFPEYTHPEIVNGLLVAKKNKKVGMISSKGKNLVDFIYDDIWDAYGTFDSGPYLIAKKDGKYGILDTLGNSVIPATYKKEVYPRGDYFVFKKNNKYGLLSNKNTRVLPAVYDRISDILMQNPAGNTTTVFSVEKNKLEGVYFPKKKLLIPPKFDNINVYNPSPRYNTSDFPANLVRVEHSEKIGFYSLEGKEIIAPQYSGYEFVTNDKVILQKDPLNNQGLYDLQKKKLLIPYEFLIEPFPNDSTLFKVQRRIDDSLTNYAVYDLEGEKILPMDYQEIRALGNNNFLLKKKDSLFSIWNSKTRKKEGLPFKNVIPNSNTYAFTIFKKKDSISLLKVTKNSKTYLYDYRQKKLLLKKGYNAIEQLKNGYFTVTQKDFMGDYKYGYANTKGKLIVPVMYDTEPNEYLATFENKDYLPLYKFNPEKSRFITNDYVGYADLNGKVLVPPTYELVEIERSGKGFIIAKDSGSEITYGLLNSQGKEIIPPIYQKIIRYPDQQTGKYYVKFDFPVLCKKGDLYLFIDKNGKEMPFKTENYTDFTENSYWY